MTQEIKQEIKIHEIWKNLNDVLKQNPHLQFNKMYSKPIVGKYQYIYSSEKGKISLVEFPDYFNDGVTIWEIYCLDGDLFEDVERFTSFEKAEKKVKEYLE